MKDKNVFIDTNVLIYYLLNNNSEKHKKAVSFFRNLENNIYINTQVINEIYNVLLRKKIEEKLIQFQLENIIDKTNVAIIDLYTIKQAWEIKNKNKFSIWDSLIISSAIETESTILYSEDMQSKQKVLDKITIINPFLD